MHQQKCKNLNFFQLMQQVFSQKKVKKQIVFSRDAAFFARFFFFFFSCSQKV